MHPASISVPATEPRFLPAPAHGFAIGDHEPLSVGLRRVTVSSFDDALAAIASEPMAVATHEIRKTTKRLRALLRLVRPGLGDARYRSENAMLRDTAGLLAPLRDADVRVLTLDSVRERFDSQLRPTAFSELADRLAERRRRAFDGALDSEEWGKAAYALRSARARYAAWPVDEEAARAHGMKVIRHEFSSVSGGLGQTYSRGRQEMAEAGRRPTADNFHTWRKRAKYLRHQVEIITPLFPEVLDGYGAALTRLGDVLGQEHDLVELLRFLASRPDLAADPVERSMLVALVQHRRAELQTAAMSLGSRVYAESPDRFIRRIGDYWTAWDSPVPVGYTD